MPTAANARVPRDSDVSNWIFEVSLDAARCFPQIAEAEKGPQIDIEARSQNDCLCCIRMQ